MSYLVKAIQTAKVTHSCSGNFTGANDSNVIVVKDTNIELHKLINGGLQLMLDVPLQEKVATLVPFRPPGKMHDLLLIGTEEYKYFVVEWDDEKFSFIKRSTHTVDLELNTSKRHQLCTIDPSNTCILLNLYDGQRSMVVCLDDEGKFKEQVEISLGSDRVLDIKFLNGCLIPTFVVLQQDKNSVKKISTYELNVQENFDLKRVCKSWDDHGHGADMLIPLLAPLCGVLIIGGARNFCCSNKNTVSLRIDLKISAYTMHSMSHGQHRCVVNDRGVFWVLDINFNDEQELCNSIRFKKTGEALAASTMSHIDRGIVYIGSIIGDSKLVEISLAKGKYSWKSLEIYKNLGPILDFTVRGKNEIVTCSGDESGPCFHVIQPTNESFKLEIKVSQKDGPPITRVWALKPTLNTRFHAFLVLSLWNRTLTMRVDEGRLLYDSRCGFDIEDITIDCHEAVHNQFIQITGESVRLIHSSGMLQKEWNQESKDRFAVGTANASQVLVATRKKLFYLEIGDGTLTEVTSLDLESEDDVTCLEIISTRKNKRCTGDLAAMATCLGYIKLYELPKLNFVYGKSLGASSVPRSILMYQFKEAHYLFCSCNDGYVFSFSLDVEKKELVDENKRLTSQGPTYLRSFLSKSNEFVYAVAEKPFLIWGDDTGLHYHDIEAARVQEICYFNHQHFLDHFVIIRGSELAFAKINDTSSYSIRSIMPTTEPYALRGARAFCYQENSDTFLVCCSVSGEGYLVLLNGHSFEVMHAVPLDIMHVKAYHVINSYSNGEQVYFLGIRFLETRGQRKRGRQEEKGRQMLRGRILRVRIKNNDDGAQKMFRSRYVDMDAIYGVAAYADNELLVAIDKELKLYKFVDHEDGLEVDGDFDSYQSIFADPSFESLDKYAMESSLRCLRVYGDKIAVGDASGSVYTFHRENEGFVNEDCYNCGTPEMTVFEFFDQNTVIGANEELNLIKLQLDCRSIYKFRLGFKVDRFCSLPDFENGQRRAIYVGHGGEIGFIFSLKPEDFSLLQNLQIELEKITYASEHYGQEAISTDDSKNFIDGNLIKTFLGLSWWKMNDIVDKLGVQLNILRDKVKELESHSHLF